MAEFTARIAYEWVRKYYQDVGRLEIPPFHPRRVVGRKAGEFVVFRFRADGKSFTVTVTAQGDITPHQVAEINPVSLGETRSLQEEADDLYHPLPQEDE